MKRLGEVLLGLWRGVSRKPGSGTARSPLPGYGVAVLAVGLTLLLKLVLDSFIQEESSFLLFFGAVMVAAWFGGLWPGLLATALAALASNYFFFAPEDSLWLVDSGQGLRLFLFVLEGVFISLLVETIHSARWDAEARTSQSRTDQENLRRSEERFRSLVEGVKDYAIFMLDPYGRVASWNEGARRIEGYREEEIVGRHYAVFYPEEDVERGKPARDLGMAKDEGVYEEEGWRVREDGSRFWASILITPLMDDAGQLLGYSNVTRDITEQQKAEQALRESEERYRVVAETASDAIFVVDEDSRILFVNSAAGEIFGYDTAQMLGDQLTTLMPEYLRHLHEAGLKRYAGTGTRHLDWEAVQLPGLHKSGWEIPLEISFGEFVKDDARFFTGFVRDITERKRAEEEIKRLGRQNELILNSAGEGIFGLNLEGTIEFVNPTAAAMLGYEVEELIGRHQHEMIHHSYPDGTYYPVEECPIFAALRNMHVSQGADEVFWRKDGTSFPVEYVSTPIRENGGVSGLVLTFSDVTERKRAEEALRESENRLSLAVETTGLGTWDFDPVTEELTWDERCKAMFGLSPEARVDYEVFLAGLHPKDRDPTNQIVRRALDPASGGGFDVEYRTVGIEDRVERWVAARGQAFFDAVGRPVRFVGTVLDITERKRAEEALRQSERLYRVVIEQATENIFLVDLETRCIMESNPAFQEALGYTEEELRSMTLYDIVVADRKSIDANVQRVFEQNNVLVGERKYRRKDGSLMDIEVSASTILRNGRETLCVVAHDITERKRAEEVQRFLSEASAMLASSLDYRATLASLTRLAVPHLADWCAVDMVEDDDSIHRLAVAHEDPEKIALAHELQERYPPDPADPQGVPHVLRTGQPEFVREFPEALLDEFDMDAEHREMIRGLGLKSYMIVPLTARGRTLGAITLVTSESGRRYTAADLELAEELARRAALAVDNARLYKSRSEIARVLQRGLLPARLPEVPGLEVGLRYLPAGEMDVGGDFYDLFDARIDVEAEEPVWGVVIGDVCGKGAEAAAVLALARYTIRAVARHETRPSAILDGLNEVMLRRRRERDDHKFCTIAYLRLEMEDTGARITLSRGGHSVPVLLEADGNIKKIGDPGRAIGVFDDASLTEQEAHLTLGDALVLYTDGVIEARSPDGAFFGEERFAALLHSCTGLDAQTIADRIESAVLDFQENGPRDDVAVLVLRVPL